MSGPAIPPTKRLSTVDHCIYCGISNVPLTDEHIIPRGLNGTVLLPKSTCKTHQDLTSGIEFALQKKGMFLHPRLLLAMRSYKRKQQPSHIKMEFISANNLSFKKNVPVREAASMLVMPMFLQARSLTEAPPLFDNNTIEIQAFDAASVGADMPSILFKYGAVGIRGRQRIDIGSFLRYLCKIAYGLHVAARGPFPRDQSPALSLLLGQRQDFGNWVGCVHLEEPPRRGLDWHQIDIADDETKSGAACTVVRISLFNFLVPCTYIVVTRCPDYSAMVQ